MTTVLELFDWIDEGRTCRPITDEDRRLFIGYSATPLPGAGVGFIATHDRKRCYLDHSAPTPKELIAKLDAIGIERRHWQLLDETQKWGLSARARAEVECLMVDIPLKSSTQ